jgi:hypothetical protein
MEGFANKGGHLNTSVVYKYALRRGRTGTRER